MPEDDQDDTSTHKDKKASSKKWLKVLLAVVILAIIGVLIWLFLICRQHKSDLESENRRLRNRVEELQDELAGGEAGARDVAAEPECSEVTDDLKETIADAVTSRNYAALEGYMAEGGVTVVYAATEFGGEKTPAEAVSAMDYLNNGTAPWDFSLPAAAVDGYRAGFYEQYFPADAYVGQSSDDLVVSFGFDDCANIDVIFIAANADTL